MKIVLLVVVPIALIAILGEVIFSGSEREIAYYEQRLADNVDQIVTAEQRQMIYYILRDRPQALPDRWTPAETDTFLQIFSKLANDFPPASPAGRLRLVSDKTGIPDFPVLQGQSSRFRNSDGDIEMRPSNGLAIIFDLFDADKGPP